MASPNAMQQAPATDVQLQSVGIVGLGTMGAGIALACATAGVATVAWDLTDELAERGRSVIERQLARAVEKDRIGSDARDEALRSLNTTSHLDALAECDIVIEAVLEDLELKKDVFARIQAVTRADAVLATNTSALSVTAIAGAVERPERVVGMHFFNPASVLPLVEVVRAELSSDHSVERACTLARQIGKRPIVCRDTPGFVVNRILIPPLNEAVRALEEGVASAEDIDFGMRTGTNWPIGPLALLDLIGIDIYVQVCDALWEAFHEPHFAAPPRLVRMADAGVLGRKSGRGFYSYNEEGR